MRRDIRGYLSEAQHYIVELQKGTDGRKASDLDTDPFFRRAVEREYEIIAEIIRRMSDMTAETKRRLSQVSEIISFRNLLAHEYDRVSCEEVWRITVEKLPVLKEQIDAWAAELGMKTPPEPAS